MSRWTWSTSLLVLTACAGGGLGQRPRTLGAVLDPEDPEAQLFGALAQQPRVVEVGLARVRFLDVGPSVPSESATPWLVVHGLGGSMATVAHLIVGGARAARVLALDLPGFGGSLSLGQHYDVPNHVRVIDHFQRVAGAERVHLVCHSLGGQVCLAYAIEHPERVRSLALIDAAGTYDPSSFLRYASAHFAGINVGAVDPRRHPMLSLLTHGDREIVRRVLGDDPVVFAALSSFAANYRSRLREVRVPTLILWGGRDPLFPVDNAFFLKDNIDASELHVLRGVGHAPHQEQPDRVLAMIHTFHQACAAESPARSGVSP